MLTSKERAELRARANALDTTLMIGKSGITETLVQEAQTQLTARELVKGKVLDGAMMSPREACDALCRETGAEGIAVIGTKFVIYRFSPAAHEKDKEAGRAKRRPTPVSLTNPVRKGAQARRAAQKKAREQRNEYFRQTAIDNAIRRNKEKSQREED